MQTWRHEVGQIFDAVVAGYICVDIAPLFPASRGSVPLGELLRPGKLVETDGISITLGGVVPNTGLAMLKFGCRVYLNGLVGNDVLGSVALELLSRFGPFPGVRSTERAGTAYGIVLAPPGVDRAFLGFAGASALFSKEDVDYKAIKEAKLFHFGYPPLMRHMLGNNGTMLARMFEQVSSLGVITSLDMTLPDPDTESGRADWRSILQKTLPHVDIFAPSAEELLFMLDRSEFEKLSLHAVGRPVLDAISIECCRQLAAQAISMGARVVVVKAGYKGLFIKTTTAVGLERLNQVGAALSKWADKDLWVPAFPAEPERIKNACGAGDAAIAAFLTALLRGETLERAGLYAALAGRDNLYGADAISGLRDWASMTADVVQAQIRGPTLSP